MAQSSSTTASSSSLSIIDWTTSDAERHNNSVIDALVAQRSSNSRQEQQQPAVLVTGVDGYLAGVLVQRLLRAGFTVHGTHIQGTGGGDAEQRLYHTLTTTTTITTNSNDNDNGNDIVAATTTSTTNNNIKEKNGDTCSNSHNHMNTSSTSTSTTTLQPSNQQGTLKLFYADLLVPHSFDAACAGCDIVFHTASPFFMDKPPPYLRKDGSSSSHCWNAQRDLIEPAVQGTRNVLQTCHDTATVRRVVLTSSMGAMYAHAADTSPERPVTEADWNRYSSPDCGPYFFSKTLAEQTAWVMAAEAKHWTLVTLHPALILGPGVRYHAHSESFKTIHKCGSGHWTMWCGSPPIAMPAVDVREVVAAHIIAALDERVQGRHVLCAAPSSIADFCRILSKQFPNYPIPRWICPIPRSLASWVVPWTGQGADRITILRNMNCRIYVNANKSQQPPMQLRYRPVPDTLRDMYQQMIQANAVQPGPPPEFRVMQMVVTLLVLLLAVVAMAVTDGSTTLT